MTHIHLSRFTALVVVGLLSTYSIAAAQSPDGAGVVRISDQHKVSTSGSIFQTSCDVACDANGCCPMGLGNCCNNGNGPCNNGAACGNCNDGRCGNGSGTSCQCGNGGGNGWRCGNGSGNGCRCGNGSGNGCRCGKCNSNGNGYGNGYGNGSGYGSCGLGCPCGNNCGCRPFSSNCGCRVGGCFFNSFANGCGPCGGRLSQPLCHFLSWANPCSSTCCKSPGYGFVPPTKHAYYVTSSGYQHAYPASWVGGQATPGYSHRPAVYMPTDTTQLGYYYQHVPQWQPMPAMIPPAMQGSQWHILMGQDLNSYPVGAVSSEEPTPAESGEEQEMAPAPPEPNDTGVDELERSVVNPNLVPVIR